MFPNFCKVLAQVANYIGDVVGIVFWYFVDVVLYVVVVVVKQRVGQFAEVDDEVERVSYLVYDTRSQQV